MLVNIPQDTGHPLCTPTPQAYSAQNVCPSLLRLSAEIKCNGSAALRLRKLAAQSHECAATAACIGAAAGEGPAAEHGTRAIRRRFRTCQSERETTRGRRSALKEQE